MFVLPNTQKERFDQMSKHRTSTETFANSLCRDLGHDWMTTAAANYRVCKREKCRASQRLVAGQWVSNASAYRFHDPVVVCQRREQQPQQIVLWESRIETKTRKHMYTLDETR
jgi:hypothetical protein